jgi:hypothetical protein
MTLQAPCSGLTVGEELTLITAILAANLSVAAILFGVLGFLYSVFAVFARQEISTTTHVNQTEVDETTVDLRPHRILPHLRRVANWLVIALGLAVIIAIGDTVWLFFRDQVWLCGTLILALLLEVVLLFIIACYVTFKLMPVYRP